MVDCLSFSLLLGSKNCFFRRYFFSHWFILDQAMVFDRIQPLHSVASPQTHDVFSQEANTFSYVHLLNLMGVTSLGRHTRPTCHQAPFEMFIKKGWCWPPYSVFSWTSSDARGLGLLFMVCACVVGLLGYMLIWMRETWGVFWRSAHGPTTRFTWLRIVKVLGQTAHASNHHATRGLPINASVLYPMGSHEFLWPNMGIATSLGSRVSNAAFWLANTKFAALWLVTDYCSPHYYWPPSTTSVFSE